MKKREGFYKRVVEDFCFIMKDAPYVTSKINKMEFRRNEFKLFSAIDKTHYKSESLSKIK